MAVSVVRLEPSPWSGKGWRERSCHPQPHGECLLVRLIAMLQPTGGMATARVVMGPVEHSAFGVPNVLSLEGDGIPDPQGTDPRSYVDVVCDQQRLPGSQFDNEPLMPAALVVVGQDLRNSSFALDLNSAGLRFQRSGEFGIAA